MNYEHPFEVGKDDIVSDIGFSSPYLVSCTLPHAEWGSDPYDCNTPWCALKIVPHPDYGVPYGKAARLFMAYVQSDVVRTKCREIVLADTLYEAARRVGVGTDTRAVGRFKRQLMACFGATWFAKVDRDGRDGIDPGERHYAFRVASSVDFAYDPRAPHQQELWAPKVTVSQDFYDALQDRVIPYRMDALKALSRSPLGMDLYTWLCCTAPALKAPKDFPYWWFLRQWGASYPNTKRGRNDFQKKMSREIKKILDLDWRGLRVEQVDGAVRVHPSSPHVPRYMRVVGE